MRFSALGLLLLLSGSALALVPGEVSPPPPGHFARDLTGSIRESTLAALDVIAAEVDSRGEGQLAIAVVDTTSGHPPRDFATALFNHWGVGRAGANDGILLFVALSDRKAEIILGDGLERISTFRTDEVMAENVVANFKKGDPDQGLISGAQALAALLAKAPSPAEEVPSASAEPTPPDVEALVSILAGQKQFPNPRPRGWTVDLEGRLDPSTLAAINRASDEVYALGRGRVYVLIYRSAPLALPIGKVASLALRELPSSPGENVYLLVASTDPVEVQLRAPALVAGDLDGQREMERLKELLELGLFIPEELNGSVLAAATATAKLALEGPPPRPLTDVISSALSRHGGSFFGGLGVFGVTGLIALKRYLRRRPRGCGKCGQPRERLSEEADDVHLSAGQRAEEKLASVDYDVWFCESCNDAQVVSYGAWFSSYSKCSKCYQVTAASSSTTLVSATYDHGGTVKVTERCQFCGAIHSFTRHTARLTRSSSSSSSSSSRSSSSRSSFRGGRSSGRGSSGSW